MKTGVENKKQVVFLSLLGLTAAYLLYSNVFSGSGIPTSTPRTAATPEEGLAPTSSPTADIARGTPKASRPGLRAGDKEFHPAFRKKGEEIDPMKVDPTVRLDLLAKVQAVPQAGGERDLFQILKSPPVKASAAVLPAQETKVFKFVGPVPPPPPAPPQPPPAEVVVPIPLKYFGFCLEHGGAKLAYFSNPDGDEILQATEGTTLKGRYRVIKIGIKSVVMEDTQSKKEQTLPFEQESVGG